MGRRQFFLKLLKVLGGRRYKQGARVIRNDK